MNMKIGILSMQKIPNYGSFLQALSLKKQMELRGHDVYFIDIVPGRKIVTSDVETTDWSKKFDRYFLKRVENFFFYKKMRAIHTEDYEVYLQTDKIPEDGKFDLVIIGSDEVFNATCPTPWGFSTQLFGNIPNAERIVTYAASCGTTTYEEAQKYGIVNEIVENLSHVVSLSVRDENSYDFIRKIDGRAPLIHLDPVFISDFDEFIPSIKIRKPYLLVYAYENRISDPEEIQQIKDYARENKLQIISVGMQQRWCNHNIKASAFELLGYVKNADCIVTDTFHGTVFSIKYNKPFATIIRESNRNKLHYLLKSFDLDVREVTHANGLSKILQTPISYKAVNLKIDAERKRTSDYFDLILKGL